MAKTNTALILRSLALFAVLYQFRLIATDLADTPVFAATLFAAFAAAIFLLTLRINGSKPKPTAALIAIALIPWIARAFVALPRLFIPNSTGALAINLDSLLLNLDRNNFVSLLPFYWAAVTTWFCARSRKFLRAAIIADAVLLVVVFSIARTADIGMYRWPIVMIVLFAGIVFLQALALLFSPPPEMRLRKSEAIPAIAAILALIILGGFLFLKPSQERAVEKGGGLLEPKLFSFDFSQFLRLDSEISMNDDLILIVKKDSRDDHILLRRSVMSGYSRKQGFYRIEALDEKTHPQRLPERPAEFSPPEFKAAQQVSQEYFLVNFDAAAFVGMKEPVAVTPYENWDASSFSSAYAVESLVSGASATEIARSTASASGVHQWPGPAELGLNESEFKTYTDYGGDERIRAYAEELTEGLTRYGDKVRMIHNRLKYGEYRYSLKPGIAPDGDQLAWFLFQSKRGYCSYYAFAMALMLRSIGIPARVAAGFFIDPETNTFDYYPVRSDMAHAWVEVPFPGYGWIEYDPTSEQLAEDEEFRFSSGVDPALFERLMREILENRSRLRVKEGQDEDAPVSNFSSLTRSIATLLRTYWLPLLLAILAALFIAIRCGFFIAAFLRRSSRKRSILLWQHAQRRLRLAGLYRLPSLSEAEWALQTDRLIAGIYAMYQAAAAARFAPGYTVEDFSLQQQAYRTFSAEYREKVPPMRRLMAWIMLPLAFVIRPKVMRNDGKGPAALLILLLFVFIASSETRAQNDEETFSDADELYMDAAESEYAEFWERAIELYKEGGARFPDDPRFPWSLGNLYYSRSLYGLAWDEYRRTEELIPQNTGILISLARTAGYLNRDQTSVEYYERALTIDPDNKDAIGSLGWMYYKVHRLGDGERLLSAALERFGDDADFAMTLGTVYSDMYRYDEGKYWYNKAIAQGQSIGDRIFTAVAYYNLSILESHFYKYDLSMDATNSSLQAQVRASGRLARGELHLRQLNLEQARKDYEAAYETDTSPLAKLNLAQVYQISGRLEEARLYAEDCLRGNDLSWMLNYGIDPDRYKRDIHEILYKTYAGLANAERLSPWARSGEKIRSLLRRISYNFKHSVHRTLYRKYSLASALAYGAAYGTEISEGGDPHLDSYIQYYNAFESYPRRALTYLNRARDFESSLIPAAEPSYNLEEGLLLKNEVLVEKALATLDPLWEREMISQCYKEFAGRRSFGIFASRHQPPGPAAEELFALNRGALPQAGISLPVEIRMAFNGEGNFLKSEKVLLGALKKAGFKPNVAGTSAATNNAMANNANGSARFVLNIGIAGSAASGYSVLCELSDSTGEIQTLRRSLPLRSLSKADVYDFARTLGGVMFRVE
ncbi:transglutaminase [Spirochaetia bacterium]|nr:transglutaminase [Spirochaetia bacterium]